MSTPRPFVLVTRSDYPQVALKRLREECDVDIYPYAQTMPRDLLLKRIEGKNGLLCVPKDKIDEEFLDAAEKSLKVVATMSAGYDHLSLKAMKARGVKAGNSPGRLITEAVAEYAVGLLITVSRRFLEAHNELINGGWGNNSGSPIWMLGSGLLGSTVGIFGFGGIGQDVVRKLQGFSVGKFVYNSRSKKKEADDLSATFVSFDDLLQESDFLIITCSLTEETKGIFNKEAFAKIKRNAILINVSRGAVVDQTALIDALNSGQIQAAGLDVMTPEPLPLDHPLLHTPNLTLMPHIASAEVKTRDEMALLAVNNIIAGTKGEKMPASLY